MQEDEGTGFKLMLGMAMFFIVFLLWIPYNSILQDITDVLNDQTTDADTIERNNIVTDMFGAFPIFVLMAIGIWIFKNIRGNKTEGIG